MKPAIYCTIWIKNKNKYTGTVANDGDILNAGKMLNEHWNSLDKINVLLANGPISSVGSTLAECEIKDFGEHLLFKDIDEFEMKTTSRLYQNGSYVYIFDIESKEWFFGSEMKLKLADILNRIK